MSGRNPDEPHRVATPLELLFDLTFVVAFGQAANNLAHLVAEGHLLSGSLAFSFAMIAICLAWMNFTWFASAYDVDDWFYRVTTLVQMVGVVILALGIPAAFHSIDAGGHVDNLVMVAGYVVMRVAMIVQWLRVAKQDPVRRRTALGYVLCYSVAQLGWVALALLDVSPLIFVVVGPLLMLLEIAGPAYVERKIGATPWHAHHLAERFSLMTIIALGEGVIGTIASVSALVEEQGWSTDVALTVVAGIGLTFSIWWIYFAMPSGAVLAQHRHRAIGWAFGHVLIFGAVVATGAGLHAVAYVIEGVAHIGTVGAVLAVAVPVALFFVALTAVYTFLLRHGDRFHVVLFGGAALILALAVALAFAGASIGLCLAIITLAPALVVVGYETIGHRHEAAILERIL